ncbi:MAG TPA: two-component system response regulator [Gammaproteobacteria bacterium]|jgi:CheY-like chemotaxis protein|nr:two-component system response regulator [Gammaproteobacteria bacterium]
MIKDLTLLLVEDDDVVTESIQRAFQKAGLKSSLVVAEHGQIALDILRNTHPDRSIHKPYVVLLDLNMPVMNGFEFLEQIREDPALRDTVVFVLTTSNVDSDRTRAYYNNVAGYMVKSSVGPQFSKLAMLLDSYRDAVELPE